MARDGLPAGTSISRTSPKFMKATLGDTPNTVHLQRGWRHYGQPLESTLDAIVEVRDDETDAAFIAHHERVCMC